MLRLLPEALVLRVSAPAPALREERAPPVAMVAVSAPPARSTDSNELKLSPSTVP